MQNSNRGNSETSACRAYPRHSRPLRLCCLLLCVCAPTCVNLPFVCEPLFCERAPPCTRTHIHTHVHIRRHQSVILDLVGENTLQIRERGSEGKTYHLTLYYIRLQSHMASQHRPNHSLDLLWRFDAHCLPRIYNHDCSAPQGLSIIQLEAQTANKPNYHAEAARGQFIMAKVKKLSNF